MSRTRRHLPHDFHNAEYSYVGRDGKCVREKLYTVPGHRYQYVNHWYRDAIDPVTGNYIGYPQELPYKPKHLKHKHRQHGKKLIRVALQDMKEK